MLDVGCGTGSWLAAQARAFAERGASWFGVDPSDAMLARARAKLPQAALHTAPAEAEQLALRPGHVAVLLHRAKKDLLACLTT